MKQLPRSTYLVAAAVCLVAAIAGLVLFAKDYQRHDHTDWIELALSLLFGGMSIYWWKRAPAD